MHKMARIAVAKVYSMARLKLNVTGLTYFIRAARDSDELHKVLVEAFETANDGEQPTPQELEQMFLAVDTIRQSEGLERLWIQ